MSTFSKHIFKYLNYPTLVYDVYITVVRYYLTNGGSHYLGMRSSATPRSASYDALFAVVANSNQVRGGIYQGR
jgi:hypothetical protein